MIEIEDSRRAFEIEARALGIHAVWLERSAHSANGYAFREADRMWQVWVAALTYANRQRPEVSR